MGKTYNCGRCGKAITDQTREHCAACGGPLCVECWEFPSFCAGIHKDAEQRAMEARQRWIDSHPEQAIEGNVRNER